MTAALLTLSALHWAILVSPGVNMLVVSQLGASGQRAAAVAAALGVTTVAVLWATLAVLGLHAVLATHAGLQRAVQTAGALYLCHLAWRLWRARSPSAEAASKTMSTRAGFRLGFLTNLLNPKSVLFFASVFANALPPAPSQQLLAAAVGVVLVNAFSWHLFLALAFSSARIQSGYARHRDWFGRVAAVLTAGFGARLLGQALFE